MSRTRTALLVILALLVAPAVQADQVTLNVALAKPFLLADQKQMTHLKVGLTGFQLKGDGDRTPVNVAIVIDKSGSMSGEKIKKAKEAARMAVDRLSGRDIVSIIAYDHTVQVLVPATKATEKKAIYAAIERLTSGGNTALFAGVSKGAQELRKFLDKERANRIVLLSDGLANVGPSSPDELGNLGASLIKEGISVSTIGLGLGYNEDLMHKLAVRSDGNHAFVKEPADLARIFKHEFGDVLSVVAQEVVVKIKIDHGIRPVRVLGRKADIDGQTITTTLNQIYSEQEKYILIEVEVPAGEEKSTRDVASVELSYLNMQTKTTDRLSSAIGVRFTKSKEKVVAEANNDVQVAAVTQVAIANNIVATELRDKGKVKEAKKAFVANGEYLRRNSTVLDSERLRVRADENDAAGKNVDDVNWKAQRKLNRDQQYRDARQRAW